MRIIRSAWFRWSLVLGSFALIIGLSRSLWTTTEKREVLKAREAALLRVEAENARLKSKLKEAQTPEFIEKQAREKLGLVREGEVIVLVGSPAAEANSSLKSRGALSVWRQWWRLFFE